MTLSSAADKVQNLKVDTTKVFLLYPTTGTQIIEVYKTKPAKYIVSIDAFNSIGTECQVAELDYRRRRSVKAK